MHQLGTYEDGVTQAVRGNLYVGSDDVTIDASQPEPGVTYGTLTLETFKTYYVHYSARFTNSIHEDAHDETIPIKGWELERENRLYGTPAKEQHEQTQQQARQKAMPELANPRLFDVTEYTVDPNQPQP